jgi:hypothetical protein
MSRNSRKKPTFLLLALSLPTTSIFFANSGATITPTIAGEIELRRR